MVGTRHYSLNAKTKVFMMLTLWGDVHLNIVLYMAWSFSLVLQLVKTLPLACVNIATCFVQMELPFKRISTDHAKI